MIKRTLLLCVLSSTAMADESCGYKFDVNTKFEGVIQSSKNYDKKASDYVDDTRKCVVSMDLKIFNKWYPAAGTYIFGPDMTQNEACKRAEISAKEDILRKNVPEKLNKNAQSNCQKSIDIPVRKKHTISYNTDKPKVCKKIWYSVIVNSNEVLAYKEDCK
jgi:hypothetical protein